MLSEQGQPTDDDEVTLTNSVEVSASVQVSVAKVVEVALSATYGRSWTTTHRFSQSGQLDIPAHHKGWIQGVEPIIRDTGDFAITMGNTTWKLRGIHFGTPDTSRVGRITKKVKPLSTGEEEAPSESLAVQPDELTAGSDS